MFARAQVQQRAVGTTWKASKPGDYNGGIAKGVGPRVVALVMGGNSPTTEVFFGPCAGVARIFVDPVFAGLGAPTPRTLYLLTHALTGKKIVRGNALAWYWLYNQY